jgi:ankyrin repeat protein
MQAVKANRLETVAHLLASGDPVNQADSGGDWPVIMAAYLGHTAVLEALLKAGADLSVLDPGMKATALHAAAYAGRSEAAQLLIAHGIAINQQGPYNGYTALHDAVWQNKLKTAQVILAGGADPTIRSNKGQTPLELAKANHSQDLIALLEAAH